MASKTLYDGIEHTVHLSTNIGTGCEHCSESIGFDLHDQDLSRSINHYIDAHGYKLLHVGSETIHDDEGKPWHTTVAILGVAKAPAQRPQTAGVASRKRG